MKPTLLSIVFERVFSVLERIEASLVTQRKRKAAYAPSVSEPENNFTRVRMT